MPALKLPEGGGDKPYRLTVRQIKDYLFEVEHRGWKLRVDVPRKMGGQEEAPCPTELFAVAVAACQMITAIDWTARQGKELADISVEVTAEQARKPSRVGAMKLVFKGVREQLGDELAEAFGRAAASCKIANTLKRPPAVEVVVE